MAESSSSIKILWLVIFVIAIMGYVAFNNREIYGSEYSLLKMSLEREQHPDTINAVNLAWKDEKITKRELHGIHKIMNACTSIDDKSEFVDFVNKSKP